MVELSRNFAYGGWSRCARLANPDVELVLTTEVGPRVIRYGLCGGENELFEEIGQLGQTGGETWRPYGGHRLWHAPEAKPRTYAPDNMPVTVRWRAPELELTSPVEPSTGIQKLMGVSLAESGCGVTLRHRLTNHGLWPIELAAWALTALRPGGTAIIPQEPFIPFPERLTPARPLVLWTYTRMDDPRWSFGRRFIRLRQSATAEGPQKIGALCSLGWAAYLRSGHLFTKRFVPVEGAPYPDHGCNVETYTDAQMLELESLGPLTRLAPGEALEHVETWSLHVGVTNAAHEDDLDRTLAEYLGSIPPNL